MDDPHEFWRTHKQSFPRLFEIVKQTLFAPGSTTGIERIFSVAGYILRDRRTRTSDDNFENQLFANVNLDLSENRPDMCELFIVQFSFANFLNF